MLKQLRDWFGFSDDATGHSHADGHSHGGARHGHTHGGIDPSLSSSERGVWAIKGSFVILAITAALQMVVVVTSGSVALPADTIHKNGHAHTPLPLWVP